MASSVLATIAADLSLTDERSRTVLLLARCPEMESAVRRAGFEVQIAPSLLAARLARTSPRTQGVIVIGPEPRRRLPAGIRANEMEASRLAARLGAELDHADVDAIWSRCQNEGPLESRIEKATAPLPNERFSADVLRVLDRIQTAVDRFPENETDLPDEQRVLSVLITGPSGSGKEAVARLLCSYYWLATAARFAGDDRLRRRQHVAQSLAELPDGMAPSLLCGIGRDVATGVAEQSGLFQLAGRYGTVHLDEVAKSSIQHILLRIMSSGQLTPLGRRETLPVGPLLLALTTSTDQASSGDLLPDLRSRVAGRVIDLPRPALLDDQTMIDWYSRIHSVDLVTAAACRSLARHKRGDLRSMGEAFAIAVENSERRYPGQRRRMIIERDVPEAPLAHVDASAELIGDVSVRECAAEVTRGLAALAEFPIPQAVKEQLNYLDRWDAAKYQEFGKAIAEATSGNYFSRAQAWQTLNPETQLAAVVLAALSHAHPGSPGDFSQRFGKELRWAQVRKLFGKDGWPPIHKSRRGAKPRGA